MQLIGDLLALLNVLEAAGPTRHFLQTKIVLEEVYANLVNRESSEMSDLEASLVRETTRRLQRLMTAC